MNKITCFFALIATIFLSFSCSYSGYRVRKDDRIQASDLREKEEMRGDYITKVKYEDYKPQYRIDAYKKLFPDNPRFDRAFEDRVVSMEWENLGPLSIGGRIISIALDPSNESDVWVGSASGGLWKSSNWGDTWQHQTKDLPSLAVYAIAIHPANPDIMMIGTGAAASIGSLGFNSSTGTGAGVFISTNGGLNWKEAGGDSPTSSDGFPVNSTKLVWHKSKPDTVYLASNEGMWRFSIREDAWDPVFKGNFGRFATEPVVNVFINEREGQPNDFIFAALNESGLWVSEDEGRTWQPRNAGFPRGFGLFNITQSANHHKVLYAKLMNEGRTITPLFRSMDGARSWQLLDKHPANKRFPKLPGNPWMIEISPHDPDLVIGGDNKFLFRTTTGTSEKPRWERVDNNKNAGCFDIVHVDQRGAAFSPTNPELIYVVNDGGIYRSLNRGKCWEAVNSQLGTIQAYGLSSSPHDKDMLVTGTQDQGVLVTQNSGKTWTKMVSGDGGISLFDTKSRDTLYVSAQYGNHWKLIRGKEPVRLQQGVNNNRSTSLYLAPLAIDHTFTNTLYTANLKGILRTDDGGASWKSVLKADTISIITTDAKNSAIVYAYSRGEGKIYRSQDRGKTWEVPDCNPCILPEEGSRLDDIIDLEPDPEIEGVLFAARSSLSHQLWKSKDFGRSWTDITGDFDSLEIPVQGIAVTPAEITGSKQIYIGTDLGVFMKRDTETKWKFMGGNVPFAIVTAIHFYPDDKTIRIATFGRGIWKMKVPIP